MSSPVEGLLLGFEESTSILHPTSDRGSPALQIALRCRVNR
jgi:hypothetical protein